MTKQVLPSERCLSAIWQKDLFSDTTVYEDPQSRSPQIGRQRASTKISTDTLWCTYVYLNEHREVRGTPEELLAKKLQRNLEAQSAKEKNSFENHRQNPIFWSYFADPHLKKNSRVDHHTAPGMTRHSELCTFRRLHPSSDPWGTKRNFAKPPDDPKCQHVFEQAGVSTSMG